MSDTENPMMQLDVIAKRASQCTACGLSKTRRNVVFSDGNPLTKLVLVGEGPGENEDATGKPFVGRAGALLDKALLECGLSRKEVYICNVVKCRPSILENGRTRNRPPNPDEIASCNSWLTAQLTVIRPKVILCLGAPSAMTLIKKNFRITQERGQFFTCDWADWAIAAFHPAYILRQAGAPFEQGYQLLVNDIKLAWMKANEQTGAQEKPVDDLPEQLTLF